MQLLVNVINLLTLLGQFKVDLFLVVRLLVAFDQALLHELLRELRNRTFRHIKRFGNSGYVRIRMLSNRFNTMDFRRLNPFQTVFHLHLIKPDHLVEYVSEIQDDLLLLTHRQSSRPLMHYPYYSEFLLDVPLD
ncbi:hypothetical protein D3C74_300650 [compost metagenome]